MEVHAQPVVISHRGGAGDAAMLGDLLIRDEVHSENTGMRRFFWLPGFGVQLVYEPFGWRDEWKVDIVEFGREGKGAVEKIVITDSIIDIVVEGMGPTYRVIDLDQLAAALGDQRVAPSEASAALAKAQRFLESFLHRGATFPPPVVAPWFSPDHDYPALPVL